MRKNFLITSFLLVLVFFLFAPQVFADSGAKDTKMAIKNSLVEPFKTVGSTYGSLLSQTASVYQTGTANIWDSFLDLFRTEPKDQSAPTQNITIINGSSVPPIKLAPTPSGPTTQTFTYSGITEARVIEIVNELNNELKRELFATYSTPTTNGTSTIIYTTNNYFSGDVARGGTNLTPIHDEINELQDQIDNIGTVAFTGGIISDLTVTGPTTLSTLIFTNATGTNLYVTNATGASADFGVLKQNGNTVCDSSGNCGNSSSTPGGSDTEVQFNNNGSFAGDSAFTFSSSTSRLTTTNLTVTDNLRVGNAFNNDSNNINIGNGRLIFYNGVPGATLTGVFDVTGNQYVGGNLGIGTTTPGQKLSVVGNGLFSGSVTANSFIQNGNTVCDSSGNCAVSTSTLANTFFAQGGNAFGTTATLGTLDNNPLNFITNGVPQVSILTDGTVGIGTTTPAGVLQIVNSGTSYFLLDQNNSNNFIGGNAGVDSNLVDSSNFFGPYAGNGSSNVSGANYLGPNAGEGANAVYGNLLGRSAGAFSDSLAHVNFLGDEAGYGSGYDDGNIDNNFFGYRSGYGAQGPLLESNNFMGPQAGYGASQAHDTNYFGDSAGYQAVGTYGANFIGSGAGTNVTNSHYLNLIGVDNGRNQTGDISNSIYLGTHIADRSSFLPSGPLLSTNNIIIGNNITLFNGASGILDIGNVLYGSGLSNDTSGTPTSTASTIGQIGIGRVPIYRFDVNQPATIVSASGRVGNFDNTGQQYNTTSSALTSYAGYFTSASTRTSGSNSLTNVGIYSTASGAQNNYAAIFDQGNVGIGTTSPSEKLSIAGNAFLTGSLTSNSLAVTNLTSGRIPYISTGGLFADTSNMTWDGNYTYLGGLRISGNDTSNTIYQAGGSFGILAGGGAFRFAGNDSSGKAQAYFDGSNLSILNNGNLSIGDSNFFNTNQRLRIGGTIDVGASTFGLYMGQLTMKPGNGNQATFQYVGGGTIDTGTSDAISNAYGLFAESIGKSGSGSITNTYGLYIKKSTTATNNYGAYIEGNVGIGTTTPGSLLTVAGNGLFTGSVTANSFTQNGNTVCDISGNCGNSTSTLATLFFKQGGNAFAATATLGTTDANNLSFITNNTARLTIASSTGNVGIAATAPTSKFTLGTGQIEVPLGSVTAPSYSFTGDLNTGIYSTGADQLDFSTGGVWRMGILANGNVGIGTTSPAQKLDVAGAIQALNFIATSTSATSTFAGSLTIGNSFVQATPNTNSVAFGMGNIGGNGSFIRSTGNGSLAFGAAEFFNASSSIQSTGQGSLAGGYTIGRTTPKSIVASGDGAIAFGNVSTNSGSNITAAGRGAFAMGASIVAGGVAAGGDASIAWGQNITSSSTLSMAFGSNFTNAAANTFQIGYTSTPTFTTNATGVGIASTSPAYKLAVAGTVGFTGLTAEATTQSALCINTATGEIQTNAGATCTVSSARFKHDIQDQDSSTGLELVNNLRPVSFVYNGQTGEHLGFIAEDVNQVDPRLVNLDSEGLPIGVRYEELTSTLAKAIQELDAKVDDNDDSTRSLFDELDTRVSFLESLQGDQASTSTVSVSDDNTIWKAIKSFGSNMVGDIAYLKDVFVEHLTIGSKNTPTGITVYDKSGKAGCLTVDDVETGKTTVTPGTCEDQKTKEVPPPTPDNDPGNASSTDDTPPTDVPPNIDPVTEPPVTEIDPIDTGNSSDPETSDTSGDSISSDLSPPSSESAPSSSSDSTATSDSSE